MRPSQASWMVERVRGSKPLRRQAAMTALS
jgi:hypothetical protein